MGSDLPRFFSYLGDHLADNGQHGSPLFQPQSRSETDIARDKQTRFAKELTTPLFELGWRRAWLAVNNKNDIVGHVDLRSHPFPHTQHRALLGMGVHRVYRRQGIGEKLFKHIEKWAHKNNIAWIDLQVLEDNYPAVMLYQRLGFSTTGKTVDFFRIDERSECQVQMSKQVTH